MFNATLGAHGTYTTERFVLRLSPRVHELVDALTRGETAGHDEAELIQAYSTYLHETIHWWQHVGSSAGLILSLAYPAQIYGSTRFLQTVARSVGGVKPIKNWAHRAMLNGKPLDETLASANIAVNNAYDINFYKRLLAAPKSVLQLEKDTYFECVGHSFFKAYGDTVSAIKGSCDFAVSQLPEPGRWEQSMRRLQTEKRKGYYYGSRPTFANVGVTEIFEGQARFSQIQFLAASGGPELLADYPKDRYFTPLYAGAFEEYLRLTAQTWPDRCDGPEVALFLLICDLAINPTRGFPLEIENFEKFIFDVDPGTRFTRLCAAAKEMPELAYAVVNYTAEEYNIVAERLTARCGYDEPRAGLDAVVGLLGDDGAVDALMEEHRTFKFSQPNMPVRVMVSHFISFCCDKRARPEFFCWPGIWMGHAKISPEIQSLFLSHLSLFQDRGDTEQIFPRAVPGRDPANLKAFVTEFYSSMLAFDLAMQWMLASGPFRYDFKWLTGKDENPEVVDYSKRQFKRFFGVDPDACVLIDAPPAAI